jgi:hypothetical protein
VPVEPAARIDTLWIAHRVLNVAVPEIGLQGPRVVALISTASGMACVPSFRFERPVDTPTKRSKGLLQSLGKMDEGRDGVAF